VVAYGRRPKRNQRESAYVSRQRTWRTLPEPSSARTEIIKISIISTPTNMTPIEAALDSLKLLKLGETPNYAKILKEYGCDRNMLLRRHRGV
jgi:hypothetical protein